MKKARFILAGSALVALIVLAHTLDYRDMKLQETLIAEHQQARFYAPYGETDCRQPQPVLEFRIYMEWCTDGGPCYRTCDIVPRDPDASRQANRKRALQKS